MKDRARGSDSTAREEGAKSPIIFGGKRCARSTSTYRSPNTRFGFPARTASQRCRQAARLSHPGLDGDFDAGGCLAGGEVCHAKSEDVSGGAVGAATRLVFGSRRPIAHVAADLGLRSETAA
jgi:hypothetical protein